MFVYILMKRYKQIQFYKPALAGDRKTSEGGRQKARSCGRLLLRLKDHRRRSTEIPLLVGDRKTTYFFAKGGQLLLRLKTSEGGRQTKTTPKVHHLHHLIDQIGCKRHKCCPPRRVHQRRRQIIVLKHRIICKVKNAINHQSQDSRIFHRSPLRNNKLI